MHPAQHFDSYDDSFDEMERRHRPLVLAYLALLTFLFSFQVVINLYPLTDEKIVAKLTQIPEIPTWAYGLQALFGALNLMWFAAIYFWQRLGFYGFLLTSLGMTGISIFCQYPPSIAALPLLLVAVLFVALHLGGSRSTWAQMK